MKYLMSLVRFILNALLFTLGWLLVLGATAWTFGALWFDFPAAEFRHAVAIGFAIAALAVLMFVDPRWQAKLAVIVATGVVAAWWLTLQPHGDRDWQADVAQQPWAEVNGDIITLHNVRNCEYRSELDYTPHWETRTLRLSQITGVDIALTHSGSPYLAHPILSFQFADALPVAISAEARLTKNETPSALRGLYRQFELIYLAADERDVVRVRTNYRQGESLYLYRTKLSPSQAREWFLEYMIALDDLKEHPRWYNTVTTNCTASVRMKRHASERKPWDWRMLCNGRIDELLYETDALATDGLPFAELKERALVNPAGRAAGNSPDFSKLIREGRPGFGH